jgi:ATP-dependent Clp protease ATP-binding subunit ClpA
MSHQGTASFEWATKLTDDAKQALAMARLEAERLNHNFVGTEHLLLGLIGSGKGTAVAVLAKIGVDLDAARVEVEKYVGVGPDQKVAGNIPYTPRLKKLLELAAMESKVLDHDHIGTEHFLLAMLRERNGVGAGVLKTLDLNFDVIKECVLKEIDPNYPSTAMEDESAKRRRVMIDLGKRYDVYCRDVEGEAVYRNVLFKGVRNLFKEQQFDAFAEFMEIEQADGTVIFIGRHSITRFCEHGVTPNVESIPGEKD